MTNMFNMRRLDPENVHFQKIKHFCQSNPQEPWSTLRAAVSLKFEDDLDMVVDEKYVYHLLIDLKNINIDKI